MKVEWKVDRKVQLVTWGRVKEMIDEVSRMTSNADLILDLGGGAGWYGNRLSKNHPNAKILCVDIVPRPGKENVRHLKASALDIPVADAKADIVGASAILHHVPESLDKCISEVARVLKPGGLFLTQEPLANNPIARWARGWFTTDIHEEGERPLTYDVMESAISNHLEIENVEFYFLTSYLMPHLASRAPALKGAALFFTKFDEKALANLPKLRKYAAYVSIVARKKS